MTRLSGVSLIEVLVAFLLLTGMMILIVPQFSGPAATIAKRTEQAYAFDYARSRLAAYGTTQSIQVGQANGSDFGWTWRDNISKVPSAGAADVFLIKITIFDQDGRRQLADIQGYR